MTKTDFIVGRVNFNPANGACGLAGSIHLELDEKNNKLRHPELDRLRDIIKRAKETLQFELNMSNYNDDDVSKLNENSISAWQILDEASRDAQ